MQDLIIITAMHCKYKKEIIYAISIISERMYLKESLLACYERLPARGITLIKENITL